MGRAPAAVVSSVRGGGAGACRRRRLSRDRRVAGRGRGAVGRTLSRGDRPPPWERCLRKRGCYIRARGRRRKVSSITSRGTIEGLGEHAHGVGVVLEAGWGGGAVADYEDEVGAQLGRAGARLAVESCSLRSAKSSSLSTTSNGDSQSGEHRESERAAPRQRADVRVDDAGKVCKRTNWSSTTTICA